MTRSYIPAEVERRVRHDANNRCGYCLSPQHLTMGRLQIEHINPIAKGGSSEEINLWLACSICNGHKANKTHTLDSETGALVPLFNPRTQKWFDHFKWNDDGIHVIGLTAIGRATVFALRLSDDPEALIVRSFWVQAGWHPPKD